MMVFALAMITGDAFEDRYLNFNGVFLQAPRNGYDPSVGRGRN